MKHLSIHPENLASFVRSVQNQVLSRCADGNFPADQVRLLRATMGRFFEHSAPGDWGQPLGLFYVCYRSLGRATDAQAVAVGSFCTFYLAAADVFDDVQDSDLEGKPLATASLGIATNSALTLLVLGLDCLRQAMQSESDLERRLAYFEIFNRVSLVAVGAQHEDLLGSDGQKTRAEILTMHRGKTSSMALLTELGAVLAGCTQELQERYAALGADLACLLQIVDDVRDIFGKEFSPDLANGKATYPLACFQEAASLEQRAAFERLRSSSQSPELLAQMQELLHDSGAIDLCAEEANQLRRRIHDQVVALGAPRPEHRLLLGIVDALAGSLYELEPLETSQVIFSAEGGYHDQVLTAAKTISKALAIHGASEPPRLSPWHLPMFLFAPDKGTIYYPDLDGLEGEIVPSHARLMGVAEGTARRLLEDATPFLLAHELAHAWRHQNDRLSQDAWHEEWVAHRLASTYAAKHAPSALQATHDAAKLYIENQELSPEEQRQAEIILDRDLSRGAASYDYELSFDASAYVQARLILATTPSNSLEYDAAAWFRAVPPVAAE